MTGKDFDPYAFTGEPEWAEAVSRVAEGLPGGEQKSGYSMAPEAQRKNDVFRQMREAATRTRERRIR